MAKTFKKGLLGLEDISQGSYGDTFSRSTSTGGTQTITKLPTPVQTATNNSLAVRDSAGGLFFNVWTTRLVTKTSADSPYGISRSDSAILCDCTSGAITITLPAAATNSGRVFFAKKIDSSGNAMTIDPNGAELIDGAATKATTTQYVSFTIICDGTAWYIF